MSSGPPPPPPSPTPPSSPHVDALTDTPEVDVPPWPGWTIPAVLAVGFGLAVITDSIAGGVTQSTGASISSPPASFIVSLLFDLSFIAAMLGFTLSRGARPTRFGYRRVRPMLGVGALVAGGVAYYAISLVYGTLAQIHGRDKVPDLGVVGTPLFVCLIAPVCEELFFRGYLFGTLRRMRVELAGRDLSTLLAALITAILFGLAHTGSASPQYLVPLGLLGFVLCLIRWRTGSLYPCMALHSINNGLALGVYRGWSAAGTLALIVGGLVAIAIVTGPLAGAPLAVEDPASPASLAR